MKKLVVTDKTACMACLSCVEACSQAFYKEFDPDKSCIQIVSKTGTDATVKTCIQCGKCARNCEAGAIKQNAKCIACGICAKACPMGILEIQEK